MMNTELAETADVLTSIEYQCGQKVDIGFTISSLKTAI